MIVKTLEELFGPYWKAAGTIAGAETWHCRDVEGRLHPIESDFKVEECELFVEHKVRAQSPFEVVNSGDLVTLRCASESDACDPDNETLWLRVRIWSKPNTYYVFCDGPSFYFFGTNSNTVVVHELKKRLIIDLQLISKLRAGVSETWKM
jgi:hypothetical protein